MFRKKQNPAEKIITLYSEKLTDPADDTARKVALATPDGGNTSFRTGFFVSPEGLSHSLEAYKDRLSGLWTVDRRTQAAPAFHPQERMLQGLCFFDALEYCARYEHAEKLLGRTCYEQKNDADFAPYYRLAADRGDVPLDEDGQPHPAAWGEILMPGDFNDHAHEVAKRTEGRVIDVTDNRNKTFAAQLAGGIPGLKAADEVAVVADEDEQQRLQQENERIHREHEKIYEAFQNNQYLVKQFKDALDAAKDVKAMVDTSLGKTFGRVSKVNKNDVTACSIGSTLLSGTGGLLAASVLATPFDGGVTILFGCISMAAMMVGGLFGYTVVDEVMIKPKAKEQFSRKEVILKSKIKDLPEGNERTLMENFSKAAQAVFGLEQAALIHKQCRTGEKRKGRMNAGRKILAAAVKDSGMPTEEAEKLKASYNGKNFAEPGSFLLLLETSCQTLERAVNSKVTSILKESLPAPSPAPPAVS